MKNLLSLVLLSALLFGCDSERGSSQDSAAEQAGKTSVKSKQREKDFIAPTQVGDEDPVAKVDTNVTSGSGSSNVVPPPVSAEPKESAEVPLKTNEDTRV